MQKTGVLAPSQALCYKKSEMNIQYGVKLRSGIWLAAELNLGTF